MQIWSCCCCHLASLHFLRFVQMFCRFSFRGRRKTERKTERNTERKTERRKVTPSNAPLLLAPLAWLFAGQAVADVPVAPVAVRADGVAAVVGGQAPGPGVDLVLRSDVELRARLDAAAVRGDPGGGLLGAAQLRAALDEPGIMPAKRS